MGPLCGVSTRFSRSCWSTSAWEDVVVDTSGLRPDGALAYKHFRAWTKARGVVASGWEIRNVGFHCGPFVAWRFGAAPGGQGRLVSRCPVPPSVKLLFDLAVVRGKIVVGLMSAHAANNQGKDSANHFAVSATFGGRKSTKAFHHNGKGFGPGAPPTSHLRGIVALTLVPPGLLRLEAPGNLQIAAKTPEGIGEVPQLFCVLSLPPGAGESVKPCWSLARG